MNIYIIYEYIQYIYNIYLIYEYISYIYIYIYFFLSQVFLLIWLILYKICCQFSVESYTKHFKVLTETQRRFHLPEIKESEWLEIFPLTK